MVHWGDFNLIRFARERSGRGGRSNSGIEKFGSFIDRWSLIDGSLRGGNSRGPTFSKMLPQVRLIVFFIVVPGKTCFLTGHSWCCLVRSRTTLPVFLAFVSRLGARPLLNLRRYGFWSRTL